MDIESDYISKKAHKVYKHFKTELEDFEEMINAIGFVVEEKSPTNPDEEYVFYVKNNNKHFEYDLMIEFNSYTECDVTISYNAYEYKALGLKEINEYSLILTKGSDLKELNQLKSILIKEFGKQLRKWKIKNILG